jgi:8-oxo-dGTP diphosphatase
LSEVFGPEAQGSTAGRFRAVPRVVVFFRRADSVLLLRGSPEKRIWPGLLNGIGGHVEADEDALSAARREVREECGLDVPGSALRLSAVISVDLGPGQTGVLLLVFVAEWPEDASLAGQSAEGTLEWHLLSELEALPVVSDLRWLLPRIWDPGVLFARYSYDAAGRLQIAPAEA